MPSRTPPTFAGAISHEVASFLADDVKAVADPSRLLILSHLAATPGLCVEDLNPLLARKQGTTSHHVEVLRSAALVTDDGVSMPGEKRPLRLTNRGLESLADRIRAVAR